MRRCDGDGGDVYGGSHDGGGEIPETKEVVVGSSKEIEVFHSEQRMSKQVDILHL